MKNVLLPILALALLTASCNKQDYTPPPSEPPAPMPEGGIPVVFHILYEDATKENQNPPSYKIYRQLEKLNKYFDASLYPDATSTPVNIKFSAALYDPSGNLMPTPGINRVHYPGSQDMSVGQFGRSEPTPGTINAQIAWDPNKCINIWLFRFRETGTAGMSAGGFTTSQHPLTGIYEADIYITELPETMFGISLNNVVFPDRQNDLLAHEMGHYFGLFHTFSFECSNDNDDSDDYCSDTPTYNRRSYEDQLKNVGSSTAKCNLSYPEIVSPTLTKGTVHEAYYRTSCAGERFISTNIMDYYYGAKNVFTPQQRDRMEHMAKYAPLIPRADNTKAYAGFEKIEITGEKPPVIYIE